jgi:hypothetical protein
VTCHCLLNLFFRPEYWQVEGVAGWHGADAWEQMSLWPLGWRWSAPQHACRLPPHHCLPRDSPTVCLQGKPRKHFSPFAWRRGGPVGFERMIGMWCRSG